MVWAPSQVYKYRAVTSHFSESFQVESCGIVTWGRALSQFLRAGHKTRRHGRKTAAVLGWGVRAGRLSLAVNFYQRLMKASCAREWAIWAGGQASQDTVLTMSFPCMVLGTETNVLHPWAAKWHQEDLTLCRKTEQSICGDPLSAKAEISQRGWLCPSSSSPGSSPAATTAVLQGRIWHTEKCYIQ